MKKSKKLKKFLTKARMIKITRLIFITTQISALIWVFTSYGIAIYAMIKLEQVYTMTELSEPAIRTLLGVGVLKVIENIFEHNNSPVFGYNEGGESDAN